MITQSNAATCNVIFSAGENAGNSLKKRWEKWTCQLSEKLVGEYLIMPLTSTKMVKSEGSAMNNCSRDYVDQCAAEAYGLFSIRRRSGERLATLGLVCDEGHWRLDQCLGPSNSEVLVEVRAYLDEDGELQEELHATELYYVAQEVARLMNSAEWRKRAH